MTDADREAILDRVANTLLLSLEVCVENVAKVVAGEKRLALVPRNHPKVKAGPVLEFRLVSPPEPAPPPPEARELPPEELAALAEDV